MPNTIMNVRLLQMTKTTQQWVDWVTDPANADKLIIPKGFICVELKPVDGTSPVQYETLMKVGDGVTTFTSLPYVKYTDFVGSTSGSSGKSGLVPSPTSGDRSKFLAGDGSWKDIPAGALYRVSPVLIQGSSGTDKIKVEKSVDGGTTWSVIDTSGSVPSGESLTETFNLGLFATTGTGNDEVGKIKSSLLPSYVDDIINGYYNSTDGKFYEHKSGSTYSDEITGEAGKIYVDIDTNSCYRWSGLEYVSISNPIDAAAIYALIGAPSDGNFDATHHGLVPAYGSGNAKKILQGDGWTTLSDGDGISIDTTTTGTTTISLDAATGSTLGGIIAGSDFNVANDGTLSIANTPSGGQQTTSSLRKFTYDANGMVTASTSVSDTSIVGSVTYDTTASKLKRTALDGTTSTDIVSVATAVDTTSGTSSTDLITAGAVNTAIAGMDGVITGSASSNKTLTAFSEANGVVTATFGDISITSSQINNKDTTLVQSVSVNGGTAVTPATAADGSVNLSGIVTGLDYTNSSGTSANLAPDASGNIDLTSLTLNCVL